MSTFERMITLISKWMALINAKTNQCNPYLICVILYKRGLHEVQSYN